MVSLSDVDDHRPSGAVVVDVHGIDFTSRPRCGKPITSQHCRLEGDMLRALAARLLASFADFEAALVRPGPWIAGIDFPFGQARRFCDDVGWSSAWKDYVGYVERLGKAGFEAVLDEYRRTQPKGEKEHLRRTDVFAGAKSPQKFHPGRQNVLPRCSEAPQGRRHGSATARRRPCTCRGRGVPGRPLAYRDARFIQERDQAEADAAPACGAAKILEALTSGALANRYGMTVMADDPDLVDDPTGDTLDALLCAVQAAWAWRNRCQLFRGPGAGIDSREGWIADPGAVEPHGGAI